jgi:hypothetical protein
MHVVRVFSIVALLLVCGVATSPAQQYTEGVYEVSGCVNTLLLPPDFQVPGLPDLGPDVYHGTLSLIPQPDGTTLATFIGNSDRSEGQPGNSPGFPGEATAIFGPGWPGVVIGPMIIGSESVPDCIVRIGHEYLLSARLAGVGHVDGEILQVVKLIFGPEGSLEEFKTVKPAAIYR